MNLNVLLFSPHLLLPLHKLAPSRLPHHLQPTRQDMEENVSSEGSSRADQRDTSDHADLAKGKEESEKKNKKMSINETVAIDQSIKHEWQSCRMSTTTTQTHTQS